MACWLQDVAYADVEDAGLAQAAVWVVRRTRIRVQRFPRFGERFELTTFCSGLGRMWAERRTDVVRIESGADGSIDAVPRTSRRCRCGSTSTSEHWRPVPLIGRRDRASTAACRPSGGSARGCVTRPPSERDRAAPSGGRFALTECDIADHVNNAAYWQPLEEELLAGPDPGRDRRRARVPHARPSRARSASCAQGRWRWIVGDDGELHASIVIADAPDGRWRLTPRRSCAAARRPLVIGMGGGGDVVGALASAELARLYDGAEPLVGGLSWERRPIDPVPGPRSADEIEGAEPLAPGVLLAGRARACGAATCTSPSRGWRRSWTGRRCWSRSTTARRRSPPDWRRRSPQLSGDLLVFVDVGGDVLAQGDEPGLRSPLCDAIMLAAAQQLAAGRRPGAARRVRDRLRCRADRRRGARAARRVVAAAGGLGGARGLTDAVAERLEAGDGARADRGQRPGRARLPRRQRCGRRSVVGRGRSSSRTVAARPSTSTSRSPTPRRGGWPGRSPAARA